MKITEKWLEEKDACSDIIKWFNSQKETDSVKVIKKLIKEGQMEWANWFVSRILNPQNNIRYSVFAAELALPNYEKAYPKDSRLQVAIDATVLCIENRTTKNIEAVLYAVESTESAANYVKFADKSVNSAAQSAAYYAAKSVYHAAVSAFYAADYAADQAAYHAAEAAESVAKSAAYYAAKSTNSAKAAYDAADSARRRTFKKIIKYGIKIYKEQVEVQK